MDRPVSEQEFIDAYHQYRDAIFRHCFFRVGDRERAWDLTQETFTKTWHYQSEGNTIGNLRAFLYQVARNLIANSFRAPQPVSLEEFEEDTRELGNDERARLNTVCDAKDALRVIESLPEEYRQVLVMRYVDELQPREIAHILKLSVNAVSVRIFRGLRKLRTLLEKKK